MVPGELKRLYPNAKPEHIEMALKRFGDYERDEDESKIELFGKVLAAMWYGNISLCERDIKRGSTYSELLGYIVRHEEDLQKRIDDEEKEIFEKFTECTNEMSGVASGRLS